MNYKKYFYLFATLIFILSSCSDDKEVKFTPKVFNVTGKAEKGPMIRGSQIELRTLDENIVPTGNSYTATIDNDLGEFNYGDLRMESPYAKLIADGYYFNEVEGRLSQGTIKLEALVDLQDHSTINVNILTHLTSKRMSYLIKEKRISFKEARKQSQKELLACFGLQKYASQDFSKVSINGGDEAAGALIAISSLILVGKTDAEIVEYLSLLSTEFASEGTFSKATKNKVYEDKKQLNNMLYYIAENIKKRYQELGMKVEVKDLAFYFDWDNDGIAGNEMEESGELSLSLNEIDVPIEGGEFTVVINSEKKYYLEIPSFISENYEYLRPVSYSLYEEPIPIEKAIEKNVITIKVAEANFRKDLSSSINIYNARGHIVANIKVNRRGNSKFLPKLGEGGMQMMASSLINMGTAIFCQTTLQELYYTKGTSEKAQNHHPFYTPTNSDITTSWMFYDYAIRSLRKLKHKDENSLSCYQPFIDTHIALAYYLFSSRWGNIPFSMNYSDELDVYDPETHGIYKSTYPYPQVSEIDVLLGLEKVLTEAIPELEDKRYDGFSDRLLVSKDVARTLLAFVYCSQKKYSMALPLLEQVIKRRNYHLEKTDPTEYTNNAECIVGVYYKKKFFPCLDYKDVILHIAECLYHTGNADKAKEYIDQLCVHKNLTIDQTNVLEAIASLHNRIKSPSYINFMRRNGLGGSLKWVFQLLWPIPDEVLAQNPNMKQNPGY